MWRSRLYSNPEMMDSVKESISTPMELMRAKKWAFLYFVFFSSAGFYLGEIVESRTREQGETQRIM